MEINPGKCGRISVNVKAPPSKSYTHRALIIAALADGESKIIGQLDADDTRMTARALMHLGTRLEWSQENIVVHGKCGSFSAPSIPIDIADSGTSMRLLTAASLFADGPVILTGSNRMQERPIGPLVDTLNKTGARIEYLKSSGYPPIRIEGTLNGGDIEINAGLSSQFISSILIAAPYAISNTKIMLSGDPVSLPYIRMTIEIMKAFGSEVEILEDPAFGISLSIKAKKPYFGRIFEIEGDYSSASYWFALAAICGGKATVTGLNPDSVQGDRRMLEILQSMGCVCTYGKESVTVICSGQPEGIDINMADCPDIVQTVCMIAAIAGSKSRICGINHLKHKESDRIAAVVRGLRELGGDVKTENDEIIISPTRLHGGVIDPENDHRTAMCFALLGCYTGGVTILNAGCVTKSYPDYWEELRKAWKTAE